MKLPRFVPILTAFSARVAGRERAQLWESSTTLARALTDTQVVVGHDGVLCCFEPTILLTSCLGGNDEPGDLTLTDPSEVCGTAPLATILEALQALRHQLPDSAQIFITFAGPHLLHAQLQDAFRAHGETGEVDPDYVVEVVRNVARTALESKADGIALIEQTLPTMPTELQRSHKAVRKLADFYDAAFLEFRLPGTGDQSPDLAAHCLFDLASAENDLGPVVGQLGPSTTEEILPFTTTGDVPEATAIEELKGLQL